MRYTANFGRKTIALRGHSIEQAAAHAGPRLIGHGKASRSWKVVRVTGLPRRSGMFQVYRGVYAWGEPFLVWPGPLSPAPLFQPWRGRLVLDVEFMARRAALDADYWAERNVLDGEYDFDGEILPAEHSASREALDVKFQALHDYCHTPSRTAGATPRVTGTASNGRRHSRAV